MLIWQMFEQLRLLFSEPSGAEAKHCVYVEPGVFLDSAAFTTIPFVCERLDVLADRPDPVQGKEGPCDTQR
jgi:hypothetical protein